MAAIASAMRRAAGPRPARGSFIAAARCGLPVMQRRTDHDHTLRASGGVPAPSWLAKASTSGKAAGVSLHREAASRSAAQI